MSITGCLILVFWLGLVPLAIGTLPAIFVDKKRKAFGFMWTTGTILMWALFQVICVPLIITENFDWQLQEHHFPYVVYLFGAASAVFAVVSVVLWLVSYRKYGTQIAPLPTKEKEKRGRQECFFWGVFGLLLLLQLVCSVVMRYADGDDAFYVAVSTITESSNTMYKILPYSAGSTETSARHGLAPFPIWIAFLARVSDCQVTFVAHTVVSTVLIFMTYVIYGQIGKVLWAKKKEYLPVFLCFIALLVIFGDYSIYTPENFMLARSRQGKAALGNIIIPMTIYLFLLLFERIKEQKKGEWMLWVLLAATVTAACLCSTLGTFLMCLFLGVIGLSAGLVYRRPGLIWRTALCCTPALLYAACYFLLG